MSNYLMAQLVSRFEQLEAELNALDAAVGDGDHGTTMLKGLRAAAADSDKPAKAFRRASGGAAGTLFSLLIAAVAEVTAPVAEETSAENTGSPTTQASASTLADVLHKAAHRISEMGQAGAGDKTMLDALLPAAQAAQEQNSTDLHGALQAASTAAAEGAQSTCEMAAKRGRARYVENAGVGHMDAGAKSVAEILAQLSTFVAPAGDQ